MRLDPFQRTLEPMTKPVPLTVRVNAALPALAEVGEMLEVVGAGLLKVKVWAFEVPPPGAALNTVTEAVPATARSAAVIAAVNLVEETKVVLRLVPFQFTLEPATKPEPLTVSVKAAPPAVPVVGLTLVVAGAGLLTV